MSYSSNGHNNPAVMDAAERLPPHAVEAEEAVLGSLLIDPDAYWEVADFLRTESFYRAANRWAYQAIQSLIEQRLPVDVVTLIDELRRRGRLDEFGGEPAVINLLNAVPTSISIEGYARLVHGAYLRRQMIGVAGRIAALAWDESSSVEGMQADAETALFAVTTGMSAAGIEDAAEVISRLYDQTLERREQGVTFVGLPTGLTDVDRGLKGLKDDDLIIVAGRPGMGKSSFTNAIQLFLGKAGKRVAVFNLEMSAEQQMTRMLSAESRVTYEAIQTGQMSDEELARFTQAAGALAEIHVWLDDTPGLGVGQLASRARRLHAEHGLDLVIVDYLQLLADPRETSNKNNAVGENCKRLKQLARELSIPVLCLAQLSREVEKRADKRPMLADLRDSGEVEQHADVVMFLYRDDYYNRDNSERPNVVEVDCAKYRNGATFKASLFFRGPFTTVANLQTRDIHL